MDYLLHFAQAYTFFWTIPCIIFLLFIKRFLIQSPFYQYPLVSVIIKNKRNVAPTHKKVFTFLRVLVFALLIFLIAKPQIVDSRSHIIIDGIDIMLVLDISGSMQFQDYDTDKRSRLDVAKDEALRFVNKRINDAIGLVIFGNDALSRVPLTLDKSIVTQVIKNLQIGIINPDGTVLSNAIIAACNRLKTSQAKSKIMIVLTDGEPSKNDADPALAISIAKKLSIKIYTIGIGSDEEQYFMHPFYGMVPKPRINKHLLSKIARETGGKFFLASNSKDMRTIYDTIDALEKTEHETPIFNNYYDIFIPFVWCIIILLLIELALSTTIWFGL